VATVRRGFSLAAKGFALPHLNDPYRIGGPDDTNTAVLPTQAMQMLIAGYDQIRPASHRASQHLIVIGIVFDHGRHGER